MDKPLFHIEDDGTPDDAWLKGYERGAIDGFIWAGVVLGVIVLVSAGLRLL